MKIKIRLTTLLILLLFSLFSAVFVWAANTFTPVTPLNATVYNTSNDILIVNTTITNTSITGCIFELTLTNDTTLTNYTMTNDTPTYFYNATPLYWTNLNTPYNQYENITYWCNETGHSTSGNISGGNFTFKIDNVAPIVNITGEDQNREWNFTQLNTTTAGYLNFTFNITDNNTDTCRIRIHQEDGTSAWKDGSLITHSEVSTGLQSNCTVLVTATDITQEGDFTIESWANDSVNWTTFSSVNYTGLASVLKSGWNLVTYSGQNARGSDIYHYSENTSSIINRLPNCSSISRWNSHPGYKNYTTYSTATPTIRNGTTVRIGNATWIYCNDTEIYLRPAFITSTELGSNDVNITLTVNISDAASAAYGAGTRWNLIGPLSDETLNATLFADYFNGKDDTNATEVPYTTFWNNATHEDIGNITAVSWYNTTGSNYITCMKVHAGRICTGQDNRTHGATLVTVPKSYAIWIHVNQNITNFKRTGY